MPLRVTIVCIGELAIRLHEHTTLLAWLLHGRSGVVVASLIRISISRHGMTGATRMLATLRLIAIYARATVHVVRLLLLWRRHR